MSIHKTLSEIPIVVETKSKQPASQRLHWLRRISQWGMIGIALLVPITGLFRIDPVDGAFVVLGRQIWFSDFYLVFGVWILIACALIVLYSIAGTVFCGWACPQNTLSEWANHMTRKWLGKRAAVSLGGEKMQVAAARDKWANWLVLGASFLAISMVAALIPLFYFYTPAAVWSFLTFQEDARLAGSLHWIYAVFVLIIFVDVAFIRHFMCRFMCIYKVWQHSFKTKQTLHVAYDASRSDACAKCNFCVTSCFIDIDPRQTDTYTTCINCGECITACNMIQNKKHGLPGLLRFELGERERIDAPSRTNVGELFSRVRWTIPFTLLGLGLFIWGIVSYEPYHFTVYRADTAQAAHANEYSANVASKRYERTELKVAVEGLPEGSVTLSTPIVKFDTAGRQNVMIHVDSKQLPAGIHPFLVRMQSADGWEKSFRVHHFVPEGKV